MGILEVIALISLCIACIKLGIDIKNSQKNNRPARPKAAVIFN